MKPIRVKCHERALFTRRFSLLGEHTMVTCVIFHVMRLIILFYTTYHVGLAHVHSLPGVLQRSCIPLKKR